LFKVGALSPFLELKHLSLLLLLAAELEMLASLDRHLIFALAIRALQPEHDLLGGFSLLSEDGFGLATIPFLLAVVTPLALSGQRVLAFLVLRDLVQRVLSAFGSGAESASGFRHIHHLQNPVRSKLDKITLEKKKST